MNPRGTSPALYMSDRVVVKPAARLTPKCLPTPRHKGRRYPWTGKGPGAARGARGTPRSSALSAQLAFLLCRRNARHEFYGSRSRFRNDRGVRLLLSSFCPPVSLCSLDALAIFFSSRRTFAGKLREFAFLSLFLFLLISCRFSGIIKLKNHPFVARGDNGRRIADEWTSIFAA